MAVLKDEDGFELESQAKRLERLNFGVKGVNAVLPFQCETCWMRNLEGRNPTVNDRRYVQCLRRANLDAMSGRAKGTIESHVSRIEETLRYCVMINKTPHFEPRGPFELGDAVGMSLAVDMLMKSLIAKGRINAWIQFDTMRDTRSTYTKTWESSLQGIHEGSSFSGNASRIRFTSCPSQSVWFGDFLLGSEDRMGYDTRKQKYLSMPVIVEVLSLIRRDAEAATEARASTLFKFGSLICVLTAGSLRGHKGFFFDLAATRNHLDRGRNGVIPQGVLKRALLTEKECANLPEVCVCLIGKFKGENGERYHSLVLANESMSGLEVRWWVEKLINLCESEGRVRGPAFVNPDGSSPSGADYNVLLRQYLREIQQTLPKLFSPEEDVMRYGISRTFRKSAENRARRAGMQADEIKVMNRWKTVEQSKGKRPKHAMIDHYSDARALVAVTWRYLYSL